MAKALVNSAGKVLLRNGKVATTDSADCCCTVPPTGPCPTILIACDSISVSRSKCGITPALRGSQPYGDTYPLDDDDSNCYTDRNGDSGSPFPGFTNLVDCALYYLVYHVTFSVGDDFIRTFAVETCEPTDDGVGQPTELVDHISVSEEYTTALLLSSVDAGIPAYPGTWDGTCEAALSYPESQASKSISRFKYKFNFGTDPDTTLPIELSGYLKIWWTERFTPDGGDGLVDVDWTWTRGANGIAVLTKDGVTQWTHDLGTDPFSETEIFPEIMEPDTNGINTIVNIRWATSQDCTPGFQCDPFTQDCPPIEEDPFSTRCDPSAMDCSSHFDNCCVNGFPELP